MGDELSGLNMDGDFKEALAVEDARRWKLDRSGPLEVWCAMSPLRVPEEQFQARFFWAEYPGEPPSLKFRDPATGRLDLPGAWPRVRGFRPTSLAACVNWTLEGFNLHPEWRNDPRYRWDSRGNRLLWVLQVLQSELDEYFEGRYT